LKYSRSLISLCQSAANFEIETTISVLIPSHVRSDVASTGLHFYFFTSTTIITIIITTAKAFSLAMQHHSAVEQNITKV